MPQDEAHTCRLCQLNGHEGSPLWAPLRPPLGFRNETKDMCRIHPAPANKVNLRLGRRPVQLCHCCSSEAVGPVTPGRRPRTAVKHSRERGGHTARVGRDNWLSSGPWIFNPGNRGRHRKHASRLGVRAAERSGAAALAGRGAGRMFGVKLARGCEKRWQATRTPRRDASASRDLEYCTSCSPCGRRVTWSSTWPKVQGGGR